MIHSIEYTDQATYERINDLLLFEGVNAHVERALAHYATVAPTLYNDALEAEFCKFNDI